MSLVALLVLLLVACVVIWAARSLMSAFGIGDPIATVIYVVRVLVFLVLLAQGLGVGIPGLRV